ncbi:MULTISPECIES: tripartite tricarboxylate transporter permease [unclassified Modestobacter]|uniref:tripartite tricarboxylate transporter permease n=1 Tax=unclassified Modestobacter TaxID=2643866 RepID=UPI0022A9FF4C|nr:MULTISPECIES: tripartite tricarboxylate transporter permease [unclassified Modestobacter]MCZ2823136.1 tripartite tricarboxylate transporter permease [Modestobacter sp. VKM Ac-2981]MCZ2851382.1 tripartite tricarboxylate transporter permease [Modestobacter sp. VKM Ac-2982]
MDSWSGIVTGFSVALTPTNLLYVFFGVLIGTVIGVLPGLGPTATIALLLPITYTVEPVTAVILLAGIYYGSMYGGTITSVLLRLPGEAASVVTTFDGYQMAKQGRAGPALGIAAVGSYIGGTVSVIGMILLAPPLAQLAVSFGPPEYVALTVLGILLVTYLGTGSVLKSMSMAALGLLLATIGLDPITGTARFTFGEVALFNGLDFVAVAMGLFGVGEILHSLERTDKVQAVTSKIKGIWPTRKDFRDSSGAIGRGSLLGFAIGVLPGGGGVVSSLASYAMEKRRAKDPSRFGKGAIEGVAGPETANNASSTSAFIPLLTLGIPPNVVLALIFGALLVQDITPGPQLIEQEPEIFWGVIASMVIGNLMLLALNIPLVGFFVQMLRVRAGILAAFALLVTMAGVFSVNNNVFDMWVVLGFGVIGWLMKKTGFEPGPLVLAFVLGSILERAFRQSMLLSGGSFDIFVTRPISGGMFAFMALIIIVSAITSRRRKAVFGRVDPADVDETDETSPDADRQVAAEGSPGADSTTDEPSGSTSTTPGER